MKASQNIQKLVVLSYSGQLNRQLKYIFHATLNFGHFSKYFNAWQLRFYFVFL